MNKTIQQRAEEKYPGKVLVTEKRNAYTTGATEQAAIMQPEIDQLKESVKELEGLMGDIEIAYKESFKAEHEVDYDAEGHPHYYSGLDYEPKFNPHKFAKSVEILFLEEILPLLTKTQTP